MRKHWIVRYRKMNQFCLYLTGKANWSEDIMEAHRFSLKKDANFHRLNSRTEFTKDQFKFVEVVAFSDLNDLTQ